MTIPKLWVRLAAGVAALCAPSVVRGQSQSGLFCGSTFNPVTHQETVVPEDRLAWPDPRDTCRCQIGDREAAVCCKPTCCLPVCNWYVEADALWLERSEPDHFPISFVGSDAANALSTDDLDFDDVAGLRLTVGARFSGDASLEGSYFGLQHWSESRELIDPNRNLDPFLRVGIQMIPNFRNSFVHRITGTTEVHNAELNVRRWYGGPAWQGSSLLAGFRYVNLEDDFDFLAFDSNPPDVNDIGLYSVRTHNDLFGGQVGGTLARPWGSRWSVGLKLKGGLFLNSAEQSSRLLNVQPPGVATTDLRGNASDESLASLVETGVFAYCRITSNFGLRAGYDVFHISGLALATNQLDFTANSVRGQDFLNNNSGLTLHGPFVGAWLRW